MLLALESLPAWAWMPGVCVSLVNLCVLICILFSLRSAKKEAREAAASIRKAIEDGRLPQVSQSSSDPPIDWQE